MAIYEVEAPDGRILEIEGDTPPTEQDLNEIFNTVQQPQQQSIEPVQMINETPINLPPIPQVDNINIEQKPILTGEVTKEYTPEEIRYGLQEKYLTPEYKKQIQDIERQGMIDKATGGLGALGGLAESFLYGATEIPRAINKYTTDPLINMAREAMGKEPIQERVSPADTTQEQIAQGIGSFLPYMALPEVKAVQNISKVPSFLGKATDVLATGGYQGGFAGLTNEDVGALEGAKQGAMFYGGLRGATKGLEKLYENTAPITAQLLATVPTQSTERAIQRFKEGVDIFKGKFVPDQAYNNLGKKALEGIRYLENQLGKNVGQVKQQIAQYENVKIPSNTLLNNLDNTVNEINLGGVDVLNPQDAKVINEVRSVLASGKVTPAQLLGLKKKIQNAQSFNTNILNPLSNQGDYALGKVATDIDDLLVGLFPNLEPVNKEYSNLKKAIDVAKVRLKDRNIASTLRNIDNEANVMNNLQADFQTLDDLLPNNLKFLDKARDFRAREDFMSITGFSKGKTRSEQEVSNWLRNAIQGGRLATSATSGFVNPLALGIIPFTSPKVQQKIIQGAGNIGKIQPATRAAATFLPSEILQQRGNK